MHNIKTNFDKILKICKLESVGLVNNLGNVPRPGKVPKFCDLEVIALSLTAEAMSIDSENLLFYNLNMALCHILWVVKFEFTHQKIYHTDKVVSISISSSSSFG